MEESHLHRYDVFRFFPFLSPLLLLRDDRRKTKEVVLFFHFSVFPPFYLRPFSPEGG